MTERDNINKRILNKEVFVNTRGGYWAIVASVLPFDNVVVVNRESKEEETVSLWDIRQPYYDV